MKALILAAGLGTRLLPYTKHTPKPLFPVDDRPVLDRVIRYLINGGCDRIAVNTHHFHRQIEDFLGEQQYPIPVIARYEPVILGTGGAIKNLADFWNMDPFMVINSDIITDIDLKDVYTFHCRNHGSATLVLHDYPVFNVVSIDKHHCITSFHKQTLSPTNHSEKLAFTGIQVLDVSTLKSIPGNGFYSSIDLYRHLIHKGEKVNAYISSGHYWADIGTPEQFKKAVFREMAPKAFQRAFPGLSTDDIRKKRLKGDGSDRQWFRLFSSGKSLILVDHGIRLHKSTTEANAFVDIGRFLFKKKIPVPKIHHHHQFSGLVFLEDLGNVHLQEHIQAMDETNEIIGVYQTVIEQLVTMWVSCSTDFDLSWTYQTPRYDRDLILKNECHYFIRAFINNYLKISIEGDDIMGEFKALADGALDFSYNGFMHRDMQSRNIMISNNRFYFIDFQGGRMGPMQYDLASLLIDPYVDLPGWVQARLVDFCVEKLASVRDLDRQRFMMGYRYCSITRNLQVLGAFGFLCREKGKIHFEKYIPAAVNILKHNICMLEPIQFPRLLSLVETVQAVIKN